MCSHSSHYFYLCAILAVPVLVYIVLTFRYPYQEQILSISYNNTYNFQEKGQIPHHEKECSSITTASTIYPPGICQITSDYGATAYQYTYANKTTIQLNLGLIKIYQSIKKECITDIPTCIQNCTTNYPKQMIYCDSNQRFCSYDDHPINTTELIIIIIIYFLLVSITLIVLSHVKKQLREQQYTPINQNYIE